MVVLSKNQTERYTLKFRQHLHHLYSTSMFFTKTPLLSDAASDSPTKPPPKPAMMSSCAHKTQTWNLTSLIGSYLDLALTYLLLIGSTLGFFASKLLSLFGLDLPCSCSSHGLFGPHPHCIESRIGSACEGIRNWFPFDAIFEEENDRFAPVRRLGCEENEGLGDNFGAEDDISMDDEATPATEYRSVEDTSSYIQDAHASDNNMDHIIKNLERELEEAQAAYSSLYLELEKERSAAASAADEAMAMILRLQSEKASIKMESWQYQRMIEEKSAYDEEEMEMLKEIIVSREREKHVLEKEVEAYRQTMLKPVSLFDSPEDPTLMLKTICELIGRKEKVSSRMKWTDDGVGLHYIGLSNPGDECNLNLREKSMVMVEVCKEPLCIRGEENESRKSNIQMGIPNNKLDGKDRGEDQRGSYSSQLETESSILDVYVVDDKPNSGVGQKRKERDISKVGCASEISGKGVVPYEFLGSSDDNLSVNAPIAVCVEGEQVISRSCSDALSDTASHFDLRRSLMSAIDSEGFELESEVEISRKRLKTIQQGRENLSNSQDHMGEGNFSISTLRGCCNPTSGDQKINSTWKNHVAGFFTTNNF